ncbi:enoyl-CoA hydratase [Chryseobacterium sp. CFS15]|uniref:enoyl-CoA hydratase n=1 Tax=Chryseobacterium sp. CFS15 TaxID=2986946 RepID=UPI00280744A4|nr:enoyl-CoA hydratase [Chryseobacterium sp. CFS15]MDQ8141014.1 enoyl-CoA hydratase [Chryseobacterium sp. CFS15]
MPITKDIFKLIKNERKFLDNIEDYDIKISESNNFEKENLIGIYKIRRYTATKNQNQKLAQKIDNLILGLENYSENKLRFVSILNEKYYGVFYLSTLYDKIIGYLESEVDDNGNIII